MRNENALRVESAMLFHRPASGEKYTSDFTFVNSASSILSSGESFLRFFITIFLEKMKKVTILKEKILNITEKSKK